MIVPTLGALNDALTQQSAGGFVQGGPELQRTPFVAPKVATPSGGAAPSTKASATSGGGSGTFMWIALVAVGGYLVYKHYSKRPVPAGGGAS